MSSEAAAIIDQTAPPAPEIAPTTPVEGQTGAPKDEKLASRLEILMRRDQAVVNKERALKAKEAEIEAKLARIQEFETVKQNPKKALEFLGLDYNQLTQSILKDGEVTPEIEIKRVKDELENFKKSQEADKERQLQDAKRAAEAQELKAVSDFKSEITQYLNDNSSRYELISFEAQQELVFEVIDEHYTRTLDQETGIGKVMSIAEAADKVEEYLEKKYLKSKDLNKVKALWGNIPKEAQKQIIKQETKLGQPPKTLTNQLSASAMKPRTQAVTDEERVQRAIAYARGLRP